MKVSSLNSITVMSILYAGTAAAAPSVERGEYLLTGLAACGNCHTPFGEEGPDVSRPLAGGLVIDIPPFTAYAPNITPGGRVAGWSDEERVPFCTGTTGSDVQDHAGAGGFEFPGPWGVSVAPNLTPHPEDGIADHTDEELKTMITQGVRPNGEKMRPPMPYSYFPNMTEQDLDAIILYLRSLEPFPLPK